MQRFGHVVDQIVAEVFPADQKVRHSDGLHVFGLAHVGAFGDGDFVVPRHLLDQFLDHVRLQGQNTDLDRGGCVHDGRGRQAARDQDAVHTAVLQRFSRFGVTQVFAFEVLFVFVVQPVQAENFFGVDFSSAADGARYEFLAFELFDRFDVGVRVHDDMHDVRVQVRDAAQEFGRLVLEHFLAVKRIEGYAVLGEGDFRLFLLHQQYVLRCAGSCLGRDFDPGDLLVEHLRHRVAERIIYPAGCRCGDVDVLRLCRSRRRFLVSPAAAAATCQCKRQRHQACHDYHPSSLFHAHSSSK